MKKTVIFSLNACLVFAFALMMLTVFNSNEAQAQGKDLFNAKGCAACHGPDGKKPILPVYPKLAGQNAPYLEAQLKDFKSQKRKSGQSALMWGMAAQLSDSDMKAISEYLQSVK